MLQHLDRLSSIESLALPEGIDRTIHQNRLLKLAREGRKMSSRDLTRFSAARRHAILVCVLEEARATLTDEVIELHERNLYCFVTHDLPVNSRFKLQWFTVANLAAFQFYLPTLRDRETEIIIKPAALNPDEIFFRF